ncbi:MAG: 60S ribosomal export protein NMD3 [Thermoplasmata archaeon]
MFCVECGREGELIGSVCMECYAKKHAQVSLPDHVDLILCAHCSSMLTHRGWEDVGSVREAAQIAIEHALVVSKDAEVSGTRVQLMEKDERNLEAKVTALLTAHGSEFERELRTIVRLKRGSCDECSKQHGKYYEAILQVRGPERSLPERTASGVERLVRDRVGAMRKSRREVFLSKVDRVKGGLDFYFSTIPVARSVAKELQEMLCAEYKESSSLWGRKDGKDVHRMTFMVRVPGFGPGDVIGYGSKYYYVRGMSRGVVHAVDLSTGEERAVRLKETGGCALVCSKAEIGRAVVIMDSENELQVLDPETMSTIDVKKPAGFSRKGEQVRLVKTKLGAFVLSDSW